MAMPIQIHPLSSKPTQAWKTLMEHQKVIPIKNKSLTCPVFPDHVRFVCISDTHSRTPYFRFTIPDGDVLLHAGDFSNMGSLPEIKRFNEFLGSLPHKYKVVIAGNHELTFDPTKEESRVFSKVSKDGTSVAGVSPAAIINRGRDLLSNAIYLEDESVTLFGLKIYGTPWQPYYGDWAFNLPRGPPCLDKWNLIPDDVDILMTHSPPLGHGDLCISGVRAGCVELLSTVQARVKPKYHVFGHIHEGYGITSDGTTTFINASTCDVSYAPTNPPIIFDLPIPKGHNKDEYLEL